MIDVMRYQDTAKGHSRRVTTLLVVSLPIVLALMLAGSGCDDNQPVGGNNNHWCTTSGCVSDEDCSGDAICIYRCCIDWGEDDGGVPWGPPDILVEPTVLDFGSALINVELTLPLTVTNRGAESLEITAITIDEPGLLDEFYSVPAGVLNPHIFVSPFSTLTINVVLRAGDAELDYGLLHIDSNDPDEPTVTVPVTLHVTSGADIEVTPPSFEVTLTEGATASETMTIRNTVSLSDRR